MTRGNQIKIDRERAKQKNAEKNLDKKRDRKSGFHKTKEKHAQIMRMKRRNFKNGTPSRLQSEEKQQKTVKKKTREFKYEKQTQSKRESLIDFAFAQKCYQKDVLKDEMNSSLKQKKFYNLAVFDRKRRNYWKANDYIGRMAESKNLEREVDATDDYLKRNNQEIDKLSFKPYNKARIKDICKIDSQKFLDEEASLKPKINSQNGLRYYERA